MPLFCGSSRGRTRADGPSTGTAARKAPVRGGRYIRPSGHDTHRLRAGCRSSADRLLRRRSPRRHRPILLPMTARFAVALWGTLVLAGCAGLPAAAPEPRPVLALPDRWQATLPHGGTLAELGRWWSQFDDPLLERVVGAAQSASPTIASAASRIEQARSTRTAAGAALLPALDANASAARGVQDVMLPHGTSA